MGRLVVGRPIQVIKHWKFSSTNLSLFVVMGSEHDRGLIPRICESMFLKMAEGTTYKVEVSYLEIYNERVKDLLTKNSSHNLKVREHPSQGPYVQVFNVNIFLCSTQVISYDPIAGPVEAFSDGVQGHHEVDGAGK